MFEGRNSAFGVAIEFAPADQQAAGGAEAELYPVAANLNDDDLDLVANEDSLA